MIVVQNPNTGEILAMASKPSFDLDDSNINTKQLKNPVPKSMMLNMRIASMINLADVRFINLGSDPT